MGKGRSGSREHQAYPKPNDNDSLLRSEVLWLYQRLTTCYVLSNVGTFFIIKLLTSKRTHLLRTYRDGFAENLKECYEQQAVGKRPKHLAWPLGVPPEWSMKASKTRLEALRRKIGSQGLGSKPVDAPVPGFLNALVNLSCTLTLFICSLVSPCRFKHLHILGAMATTQSKGNFLGVESSIEVVYSQTCSCQTCAYPAPRRHPLYSECWVRPSPLPGCSATWASILKWNPPNSAYWGCWRACWWSRQKHPPKNPCTGTWRFGSWWLCLAGPSSRWAWPKLL